MRCWRSWRRRERDDTKMDICTLVTGMTTTLLACVSQSECHISNDRQFCTHSVSIPCQGIAEPHYVCEHPDKSTYTLPWTADNGPINAVRSDLK